MSPDPLTDVEKYIALAVDAADLASDETSGLIRGAVCDLRSNLHLLLVRTRSIRVRDDRP